MAINHNRIKEMVYRLHGNTKVALDLKSIGGKYRDNLVSGLAGAAIGGGIGALTADEDEMASRALTGAVAGGAIGAAAPTAKGMIEKATQTKEAPFLNKLVRWINPANNQGAAAVEGALGGAAAGVGLGKALVPEAKIHTTDGVYSSIENAMKGTNGAKKQTLKELKNRVGTAKFWESLNPSSKLNRQLGGKKFPRLGRKNRRLAVIGLLAGGLGGTALPAALSEE